MIRSFIKSFPPRAAIPILLVLLACESRAAAPRLATQRADEPAPLPPLPDTVTVRFSGLPFAPDSMVARYSGIDWAAQQRYADRLAALVRARWTPPPGRSGARHATIWVDLDRNVVSGRPDRHARLILLASDDSAFATSALRTVTELLAALDTVSGRPRASWCGRRCSVSMEMDFGPDPEQLRRAQVAVGPWPAAIKKLVVARKVAVGMDTAMVRLAWGRPSVSTTITAAGRTETWDYSTQYETRWVSLVNGRVVEIRTSE